MVTSDDEDIVKHEPTKGRSLDEFYEEAYSTSTWKDCIPYWKMFLSMGLANISDTAEVATMGFLLNEDDFTDNILYGNIRRYGSLFTGAIFVGMLVGGVGIGLVGDHVGRRTTLLAGLLLNTFSGLGTALAPGLISMCIMRIFGGLGVGAVLASLVPLATEMSPTSKRGAYVTVLHAFTPVGGLYTGCLAMILMTNLKMSWRVFVAACTVPSFFGLAMVYWHVPESARYLAMEQRYDEAVIEANRVARAMGYHGSDLQVHELRNRHSSSSRHLLDNEDDDSTSSTTAKTKNNKVLRNLLSHAVSGLSKLYETPEARRKTLPLQTLWFGISFGSSFVTWILPLFQRMGVTNLYRTLFFYWSANVPGLLIAGYFVDRIGRKPVLVAGLLGAGIFLLLFALVGHIGVANGGINDIWVVGVGFFVHAFLTASWSATACLTGETFPTKMRSTGLGVCTASSRLGIILAQYFEGQFVDTPALLFILSSLPILFVAFTSAAILYETARSALTDEIQTTSSPNIPFPPIETQSQPATTNFVRLT